MTSLKKEEMRIPDSTASHHASIKFESNPQTSSKHLHKKPTCQSETEHLGPINQQENLKNSIVLEKGLNFNVAVDKLKPEDVIPKIEIALSEIDKTTADEVWAQCALTLKLQKR
ncbi:unnamed protein product [Trichobilharzia regenti]|nr:unnamed protein product [Trichobilharzia regenti]